MKKLIIFFALMLLPFLGFGQDIGVRLLSIRYFNSDDSQNPVLVKVNFATDYSSPANLTVVLKSSDNVTYNAMVKEFDDSGNITYSFCSRFGEVSNFDIYFRDGKGLRSKVFNITAVPEPGKIIKN